MKLLVLLFGLVVLAAADERQCNAPNGGGLNGIIDEVAPLIPREDLYMVVLSALFSPDFDPLREYLDSPEFVASVKVLEKHEAFISIVKAACQELYFDGLFYYNKMAAELGTPAIHVPLRSARGLQRHVLGLLQDIMSLIPRDKLEAIFKDKVKTDVYVQKALQFIFTEDFKNKVETLKALPEYEHFLSKLREVGVEVDEIARMIEELLAKLVSYVVPA